MASRNRGVRSDSVEIASDSAISKYGAFNNSFTIYELQLDPKQGYGFIQLWAEFWSFQITLTSEIFSMGM